VSVLGGGGTSELDGSLLDIRGVGGGIASAEVQGESWLAGHGYGRGFLE